MMRKQLVVSVIAAVASIGTASAQICQNTCTGMVDSPRQGKHTAGDESADGVLWPPNHKYRTIVISAENEQGDPCNVTINDVRQDEAVNEPGTGNTSPDAANCSNSSNDSRVDLRGERAGTGTGRYYHVPYTMDDPDCPTMPAMDEARILVPHDQGIVHLETWIDEGPIFASSSNGLPVQCAP